MKNINFGEIRYEDLFFKISLYEKITINTTDYIDKSKMGNNYSINKIYFWPKEFEKLMNFILLNINHAGYCHKCKKQSTFQFSDICEPASLIPEPIEVSYKSLGLNNPLCTFLDKFDSLNKVNSEMEKNILSLLTYKKYFYKKAICHLNNDHLLSFSFTLNYENSKLSLMKIGQFPSVSDFYFGNLKNKEKILESMDLLKEYKKGCYASAHGFGAGSYVYMRRIFEKIIDKAYDENHENITIKPEQYKILTMNQKIEKLKNYLPDFLIKNKNIYAFLSEGIHNLSEDNCLEYFSLTKNCIDFIIEDIHDKTVKEKLRKEININLQKINESNKKK